MREIIINHIQWFLGRRTSALLYLVLPTINLVMLKIFFAESLLYLLTCLRFYLFVGVTGMTLETIDGDSRVAMATTTKMVCALNTGVITGNVFGHMTVNTRY
jgi:hypothetical protein